mgnify:CR=1 FL=1
MTHTILGYPVIGTVNTKEFGPLPLVDMPMMSDDRWQRLANEQVVKNYTREHGHAPESLEAAYAWQEEWIAETEAI